MKTPFLAAVFAALAAAPAPALDLWRSPEAAGQNALFADARFLAVSFADGFGFPPAELAADWLLPVPLPLSLGAFMLLPQPNLKSFGLRAAYHIDVSDPNTDAYFLYAFDFGFLRNSLLLEYGDEAVPIRWYDFRAGVRRLFGKFICLSAETGYKLLSIAFGVSLKLN